MGRFFSRRWLVRAGIAVVVLAALWSATALIVPPTFKSRVERIALETLGRRLTIGDVAFNPWTLSLRVDDIVAALAELKARGVTFEEYDLPGMKTHQGIATAGGAKSAWFTDSEGNIMALIQSLEPKP